MSTISCSSVNHESENILPSTSSKKILNSDSFFPKVNVDDYYQYIEFKNHIPVISNKFINRLVKDIITRMSTHNGELFYKIIKQNQQTVLIQFKFIHKNNVYFKTYKISLDLI